MDIFIYFYNSTFTVIFTLLFCNGFSKESFIERTEKENYIMHLHLKMLCYQSNEIVDIKYCVELLIVIG
jgi:hypothetical protein